MARRKELEMGTNRWAIWLAAMSLGVSSCAHRPPRLSNLGTSCGSAGAQLSQNWKALNDAVQAPGGCAQDNGLACAALRAKIERLSVDCPNNPDVIMANALLAFEDRRFTRAQQLLDELFG